MLATHSRSARAFSTSLATAAAAGSLLFAAFAMELALRLENLLVGCHRISYPIRFFKTGAVRALVLPLRASKHSLHQRCNLLLTPNLRSTIDSPEKCPISSSSGVVAAADVTASSDSLGGDMGGLAAARICTAPSLRLPLHLQLGLQPSSCTVVTRVGRVRHEPA